MLDNHLLQDVLLSWMGAFGCLLQLWFLVPHRTTQSGLGPFRFLVGTLAALFGLRGFSWWLEWPMLDRIELGIAALLPLAITLFCERLLRRHHPLWLKLLALGATLVASVVNIVLAWLPELRDVVQLTILLSLATVVLSNGVLLWRADRRSLARQEWLLARTLLVVALVAVPLLWTDFQTTGPWRLGGLAALVFVLVMVSTGRKRSPLALVARLVALTASALALALLVGAIARLNGAPSMLDTAVNSLPLAVGWVLIGAIIASNRSLAREDTENEFLGWLSRAPITGVHEFLDALAKSPSLSDARVIDAHGLAEYDVGELWQLVRHDSLVTLAGMRAIVREGPSPSAEQWCDLLERQEMTHALPISPEPPMLVVANLPAGVADSVVEQRLAVVRHLAVELAEHSRIETR